MQPDHHPLKPAEAQLRQVMTFLVEDGDTWERLPPEIQESAMALFLLLEADADRQSN
jgi:5-keto 4-deoxyuronate isomerase